MSIPILFPWTNSFPAGRSIHPDLTHGGAWQINLISLRFDFYPYHLASSDRQHWWRYMDSTPHYQWLTQTQTNFKSRLIDVIERVQNSPRRTADHSNSGGQDDLCHTVSTNINLWYSLFWDETTKDPVDSLRIFYHLDVFNGRDWPWQ